MELSAEMHEALCAHMNLELYSSYLYRAMAADFAANGLRGFAWWLRLQKKEEDYHAWKFEDYLEQRGVKPVYSEIQKPVADYPDAMTAFEAVLAHERVVTESIEKLMDAAIEDGDYGTQCFIKWFVTEQVEEEAQARHILHALRTAGAAGHGLILVDRELGKRRYEHREMKPDGFWG